MANAVHEEYWLLSIIQYVVSEKKYLLPKGTQENWQPLKTVYLSAISVFNCISDALNEKSINSCAGRRLATWERAE